MMALVLTVCIALSLWFVWTLAGRIVRYGCIAYRKSRKSGRQAFTQIAEKKNIPLQGIRKKRSCSVPPDRSKMLPSSVTHYAWERFRYQYEPVRQIHRKETGRALHDTRTACLLCASLSLMVLLKRFYQPYRFTSGCASATLSLCGIALMEIKEIHLKEISRHRYDTHINKSEYQAYYRYHQKGYPVRQIF